MIRPAEYEQFRQSILDGFRLPPNYSQWSRGQYADQDALRASGFRLDHVTAHHAEFIDFCAKLAKPPSYDLLMAYAIAVRSSRRPR
jgi:hypothetical protein